MASTSPVARAIGNLAALISAAILGAFFVDLAANWLGYRPMALCFVLRPIVTVAYGIGVLLATAGIVVWTVSMGKSQAGIGLAIGGVMLFIVPIVLPHYLDATCLPPV